MATSVLATGSYWREVLERVGRQAAQTALPIAAGLSFGEFDYQAIALAILGAVALTVAKALAGISVTEGESAGWQLLDRAVPAAAGVLVGAIPVQLTDLAAVDWTRMSWAALSAALVAVLAFYVTPPAYVQTVPDAGPVPDHGPDELAPEND